jgi:hypothetical protein
MKTVKNLSFALALALGVTAAGCAADSPDQVQDPGGGGGGGGEDDAPRPTDATGRYQMTSTFDLATNMPGKVGTVVNAIIDATDDPDDPTAWILDQIIAKMSSGTLKSLLQGAKPFVAGYLNDRILQLAPDFVTSMVQLGNDFGQIARNFGLNETLEVAKAPADYNGVVAAYGVKFKVDNVETDILFSDHQMQPITAENVAVALDATGKLTIGEHMLPVSYGKVLRIGLDEVLIPMIHPTAQDLPTLLTSLVNCQAVGQAINDALVSQFGFGGGAGTWATACTAGLQYGASVIYTKIADIDSSALEFQLTGVAKAIDNNKDGKVDALQTGKWSGTLAYGGNPAPLAAATFIGSRM